MILVLILLAILIIFVLIILILLSSKLQISINNLYVSNMEDKEQSKNKDKLRLTISLLLFNRIKWISVNFDKTKLKKVAKKININKDIKQIEKNLKIKDLKIIRKLDVKLTKLDLSVKLGIDDVILTSYLIAAIAIAISNILPHCVNKQDYKNCKYNVNPIYLEKNLYEISLSSVIQIKILYIINVIYKLKNNQTIDKK